MAKTKWVEMAHEKRAHVFPTYWYWKSVQYVAKAIGVEPTIYACYYKNHEMSYVSKENCFTDIGAKILAELKKDDKLIQRIERTNTEEIPKLIELSQWFTENDLAGQSGEILKNQCLKVYHQFMKLMEYSAMGTVVEFERPLLSNYLENLLKEKVGDESVKIGEYFNAFTTPARSTTPQQEETALHYLKLKELAGDLSEDEIAAHTARYSYIAFGYDGPGWSLSEVKERLNGLPAQKSELEKQIDEIKHTPAVIKEKQEKYARELNLTDHEKYLFKVLEILGYWKFERKLANQRSHEMMEKFIEELMRRFGFSKAQAKMIAPYELKDILVNGRVDVNELNNRLKLSIGLFTGFENDRMVSGAEAQNIADEIEVSLAVDTSVKKIKGVCAYPGKVKGVVKIVNDESDMSKFNAGDILLSTSTMPKIIPAMKKAAAIVTDSGGITCHAAIVSRELKVPCVIGTKIATKVLKDGDLVEVDAEKGIVRKI